MICGNHFGRQMGELQTGPIRCKRALSSQKEEMGVGIISDRTLPSSPESERKGGGRYFQSCKIMLV